MGDQFIITSVHFALEMKQGQKKKTTETAVLPSKKQVDTDESDVCMQTRMRNKSWSQSTLVAMGDEKKKNRKVNWKAHGLRWGLLFGCGPQWQMCGGWVRVCDDESESEIKVVYSQTSEPSTKALAWESEGGEGLTKIKKKNKKGRNCNHNL